MIILSYRGPNSGGGVSSALSIALEMHASNDDIWWYLSEEKLLSRGSAQQKLFYVCSIPEEIVSGHYRFCNNFLWPVLHDMSSEAVFDAHDYEYYKQFNLSFAFNSLRSSQRHYFVHDFQLAFAPLLLNNAARPITSIFWHVPWPKFVQKQHLHVLCEIATALLSGKMLGFHIAEYADNFLDFVERNLPNFVVDAERRTVVGADYVSADSRVTELVVQPLGVEFEYWQKQLRRSSEPRVDHLLGVPYVLSVDRVDYTKGILERLHGIDEFFNRNVHMRRKLSFVQFCQRTRPGLPRFDRYWQDCKLLAQEINERWRAEGWKPVIWEPAAVSHPVLACFYRDAHLMLISSVRDGLNLTAKEYIACADPSRGRLVLSKGAGAWDELGQYACSLDVSNPVQFSQDVLSALTLTDEERHGRLIQMKAQLSSNNLTSWWCRFGGRLGRKTRERKAMYQHESVVIA